MELLSKAIQFAATAHDGMRRKGGDSPYILHPLEAAVVAGTMTDDQDIIAAAVLHDVVEDAGVTSSQIKEKFGERVAKLVECETEDKRENIPPSSSWRIRKEESLCVLREAQDKAVLIVWLGDKLANIRSIYRDKCKMGDEVWQKFNQKDPNEHEWYYKSVAELTKELSDTCAWKEYNELTEAVFGKGGEI